MSREIQRLEIDSTRRRCRRFEAGGKGNPDMLRETLILVDSTYSELGSRSGTLLRWVGFMSVVWREVGEKSWYSRITGSKKGLNIW